MKTGNELVKEAFDAFDKWCSNFAPAEEMTVEELIAAYGKWCEANCIVRSVTSKLTMEDKKNVQG